MEAMKVSMVVLVMSASKLPIEWSSGAWLEFILANMFLSLAGNVFWSKDRATSSLLLDVDKHVPALC